MNRLFTYILIFVLFSSFVSSATVSGSIYNFYLEPQKDVLVTVDSVPQQKLISKSGNYSFRLDKGNYTIQADLFVDGIVQSSTSENVSFVNS